MILTVTDLLEEFKKYALKKIEKEDKSIKHTVAIGDNFEGLTKELLDKAIFKELNLKIVERSFVYNDSGFVSDEFDCLLVVGEGLKMSFANRFKYHIKDVIAVIQAKKNLYANDIDDSHHNLRSVIDVSEPRDSDEYVARMLKDAYKSIMSKDLPDKERRQRFTERESIIYSYLLMEAFHPLRIVIGYYGYKTEHSLREGFVKKMSKIVKNGPVRGYSPYSFPNLYICGNNTIIKNNGMPMGIPLSTDEEFYFHILTSSTGNPMYHLLELVWTRLSYRFGISSDIFDDNFVTETTHPFIACKEIKIDNKNWGWEFWYHNLSKKLLSEPLPTVEWKPIEIDKQKYTLLYVLGQKGIIQIENDTNFKQFIKDENIDQEKFLNELIESRLVYMDEGKLGLLVDELLMVYLNGKVYAGENKSGEMTSYFGKQAG